MYHSSLTNEQDELIDRLQNQAMKCIFGSGISARKMCEMAGITLLLGDNPVFLTRFRDR